MRQGVKAHKKTEDDVMKFNRWLKLPLGGRPLSSWKKVFAWRPIYMGHYEWSWLCYVWRRRIGIMQYALPNGMCLSSCEYKYEYYTASKRERSYRKLLSH